MSGSRIVWRRASRGLTFIGVGVFCLLSTQGTLYRGFWFDALSYWPVLLISVGVGLVFGRSRTPWAVLLSPLIIMSTLGYVAWRGPAPRSTDWTAVQAVGDPGVETWTWQANVALADLDLRMGSLPLVSCCRDGPPPPPTAACACRTAETRPASLCDRIDGNRPACTCCRDDVRPETYTSPTPCR